MVTKLWQYVKPFSSDPGTLQTDRRTDGRTDRRTDRQTDIIAISISRVSVLTRGKQSQKCYISPIRPKSCTVGDFYDVITCAKFQIKIFMGYDFTGGGSNFRFSHWFLHGPYNTAALMCCVWLLLFVSTHSTTTWHSKLNVGTWYFNVNNVSQPHKAQARTEPNGHTVFTLGGNTENVTVKRSFKRSKSQGQHIIYPANALHAVVNGQPHTLQTSHVISK